MDFATPLFRVKMEGENASYAVFCYVEIAMRGVGDVKKD